MKKRPMAAGLAAIGFFSGRSAALFASGAGKLLFVGRKNIDPEDHLAGLLIVDAVELTFLKSLRKDLFPGRYIQVELILVESVVDCRQKSVRQCIWKRRRNTRTVIVAKYANKFRNLRVLDLVEITSTINQA